MNTIKQFQEREFPGTVLHFTISGPLRLLHDTEHYSRMRDDCGYGIGSSNRE